MFKIWCFAEDSGDAVRTCNILTCVFDQAMFVGFVPLYSTFLIELCFHFVINVVRFCEH